MAVATGVIPFLHMAAGVTDLPMGAELAAPAMLNVVHHLVLSRMQAVFLPKTVAMLPEYIANRRT